MIDFNLWECEWKQTDIKNEVRKNERKIIFGWKLQMLLSGILMPVCFSLRREAKAGVGDPRAESQRECEQTVLLRSSREKQN